jgi:hypothetical protein
MTGGGRSRLFTMENGKTCHRTRELLKFAFAKWRKRRAPAGSSRIFFVRATGVAFVRLRAESFP